MTHSGLSVGVEVDRGCTISLDGLTPAIVLTAGRSAPAAAALA
jgi:hypothetical protein